MITHRREFLSVLSGAAIGLAANSGFAMPGRTAAGVELPLGYDTLDPEETRMLAHDTYYSSNCASGVFKTIISQLREKVGGGYNAIPLDLYAFAGGGVNGWGTVCGSLNGAGGVITLAAGAEANNALMQELMGWYTLQAFPTSESNALAEGAALTGGGDVSGEALPQTISGSPLCHVSVSSWCTGTGYASMSSERKERCARVTADVAAKAVMLLNAHHNGNFQPEYVTPEDIANCTSCHTVGTIMWKGNNTIGKIDCLSCHDPHD